MRGGRGWSGADVDKERHALTGLAGEREEAEENAGGRDQEGIRTQYACFDRHTHIHYLRRQTRGNRL